MVGKVACGWYHDGFASRMQVWYGMQCVWDAWL
jgi:hypothetical protein